MSNVRDFGAKGDGINDDTEAVLHTIEQGDGTLQFTRGDYRITRTVPIALAKTGRIGIEGSVGTAKILMAAAGPAFHLIGTHDRSADPDSFKPGVWSAERMPTVLNLEIEGRNPMADGFLVEETMQATFEGVLLRELHDGIHIHRRARNVLISHCHIYNNRGVGVFLDHVNLHQVIITGSHISYCKRGGIKVIGSEIRNLQITGNDIEYNHNADADASADIWIDASDDHATVREGTIVSNTIQAQYSPNGANILMIGRNPQDNHKAGMFTISGNLIGSQETNVHLIACRGVAVSGNVIYSGHHRNLLVDGSRNVVVGSNSFDHNPDYQPKDLCTGVRFADSSDCIMSGSMIQDCQSGQHTVAGAVPIHRDGLLEIVRCRRINVHGCQVLDGYPYAVYVEDSADVSITGCTLLETREEKKTVAMLRWKGTGSGNLLTGNRIGGGTESALSIDDAVNVQIGGNLVDDSGH